MGEPVAHLWVWGIPRRTLSERNLGLRASLLSCFVYIGRRPCQDQSPEGGARGWMWVWDGGLVAYAGACALFSVLLAEGANRVACVGAEKLCRSLGLCECGLTFLSRCPCVSVGSRAKNGDVVEKVDVIPIRIYEKRSALDLGSSWRPWC